MMLLEATNEMTDVQTICTAAVVVVLILAVYTDFFNNLFKRKK